jgi:hypothetical protein
MPVSARRHAQKRREVHGLERVIKHKRWGSKNETAIKEVVEDATAEVHKEVRRPAQEYNF